MEIAQLAAKRRSPELDVGASGATLGAHGGSTAQTWSGRSWATHAVSSVTTETRPGSVPAHRPGETPATSASSLLLHKVPPGAAAVARQTIPDDQQFAGNVAQPMREKLDDLRAAKVTPAIADRIFPLKGYGSTGVRPRGAQVRQRCGRWLNPLSSMKT